MKHLIIVPLIAIFFTSCSLKQTDATSNNAQRPSPITLLNLDMKQDASILPKIVSPLAFNKNDFLERYFRVWTNTKPDTTQKEAFWGLNTYKNSKNRTYYSPSRRTYDDKFFEQIAENANIGAFGSISFPAITVNNSFLRNIPSHEPIFYNMMTDLSEGYPFDYLANSTLGTNYPLFVSHFSKDRDFAFVQNDAVWGWIDARDIQLISQNQIDMVKNSNFITILNDKTPIKDDMGNFLFYGRVGTLLMVDSSDSENFYGRAFSAKGLRRYQISKADATTWPAILNDNNAKTIISSILGEPYGWGGLNYYRDCSLFTKDVLASFGLWLPRNSKAQANAYKNINLADKTNEEKLEIIKTQGVPYLTMLYMPGHIMLYTGVVDGKVTVTHNAWGLRTKDGGRALIGQTAITTLEIGKDRSDIATDRLLLSRISLMTILSDKFPTTLVANLELNQDYANFMNQIYTNLEVSNLAKFSKFATNTAVKSDIKLNFSPDRAKILEKAYDVEVVDNKVIFKDGSSLEFDDGRKKSENERLNSADIEDMINGNYKAFTTITQPDSDIGRVRNTEFLGKIYGGSESEVKANLVDVVWLKNYLNLKLKFNRGNGAATALENVSRELDKLVSKNPKMLEFVRDIGGTFKWRKISKTDRISTHSYAISIDINVAKSDYWQWSKTGKFENKIPLAIVEIFERYGFIWGGRWKSFDTMHFEYRPEFFVKN